MFARSSFRVLQCLALVALLSAVAPDAHAQFDKLRKRIPGLGGSSAVDTILSQMDSARVKSAYARLSLSLADNIIRR